MYLEERSQSQFQWQDHNNIESHSWHIRYNLFLFLTKDVRTRERGHNVVLSVRTGGSLKREFCTINSNVKDNEIRQTCINFNYSLNNSPLNLDRCIIAAYLIPVSYHRLSCTVVSSPVSGCGRHVLAAQIS